MTSQPHLPRPAPPRFTSLLLFSLRFALIHFASSLVLVSPQSCSCLASSCVTSLYSLSFIPPCFSCPLSYSFRLASSVLALPTVSVCLSLLHLAIHVTLLSVSSLFLLASSRSPLPEPVGLTFQVCSSAAPAGPHLTLHHPIVLYTNPPTSTSYCLSPPHRVLPSSLCHHHHHLQHQHHLNLCSFVLNHHLPARPPFPLRPQALKSNTLPS